MKIIGLTEKASDEYIAKLSKIESGDNPKAKAKTSTASGRFQFIKSTWVRLGYRWEDVFNDKLQYQAIEKFTNENAVGLQNAGCAINFATLYAAHFLGLGGALRVMRGQPNASIATVTNAAQRKANPSIIGKGTVKDFCDWLERKTGDSVYKKYTDNGWVSGPGVEVPKENQTTIIVEEVAVKPKGKFNPGAIAFIIFVIVVAGAIAFFNKGA